MMTPEFRNYLGEKIDKHIERLNLDDDDEIHQERIKEATRRYVCVCLFSLSIYLIYLLFISLYLSFILLYLSFISLYLSFILLII